MSKIMATALSASSQTYHWTPEVYELVFAILFVRYWLMLVEISWIRLNLVATCDNHAISCNILHQWWNVGSEVVDFCWVFFYGKHIWTATLLQNKCVQQAGTHNQAQFSATCVWMSGPGFFRDAFVVGKMDSDINACGNAMFGWRSWTMWSIRSRAKDANKSLTDAASFIYTQYIYMSLYMLCIDRIVLLLLCVVVAPWWHLVTRLEYY